MSCIDADDNLRSTSDSSAQPKLEPLFELGGPAFRYMQRMGIIKGNGPSIMRRSVAFLAVTWLPLLVLATIEGYAIGPTPRTSFLLDFVSYARFFVAVPLIFAAETLVGPRIRGAGLRFLDAGIVQSTDLPGYMAAAARVQRRRDSAVPEILFVLVAFVGAWFLTIEQLGGLHTASWNTIQQEVWPYVTTAGLWYRFVAIPLVQFFLFRWLWRLVIWTLFLWEVSRLRLNLYATHTDNAGGLGFLGVAHVSLSVFPFAMSCVIAAEIAFRVCFEGLDLPSLRAMAPLLAAYLLFVEVVTFGPLLVVVPLLAGVRRAGLRSYGMLTQEHNRLFDDKWIKERRTDGESVLGSPDVSSLADMGSSFAVVRQMSVFPVGRRQLLQVAVIACAPGLPLAFLLLPLGEVIRLLAGVLI